MRSGCTARPRVLSISALFLFQPLLKFIQRKSLRIAFVLLGFGLLCPERKLLLRNLFSLVPGEAALVLLAIFLKHLVASAALCPFPNRCDAAIDETRLGNPALPLGGGQQALFLPEVLLAGFQGLPQLFFFHRFEQMPKSRRLIVPQGYFSIGEDEDDSGAVPRLSQDGKLHPVQAVHHHIQLNCVLCPLYYRFSRTSVWFDTGTDRGTRGGQHPGAVRISS